jgi:hypothetical protein
MAYHSSQMSKKGKLCKRFLDPSLLWVEASTWTLVKVQSRQKLNCVGRSALMAYHSNQMAEKGNYARDVFAPSVWQVETSCYKLLQRLASCAHFGWHMEMCAYVFSCVIIIFEHMRKNCEIVFESFLFGFCCCLCVCMYVCMRSTLIWQIGWWRQRQRKEVAKMIGDLSDGWTRVELPMSRQRRKHVVQRMWSSLSP